VHVGGAGVPESASARASACFHFDLVDAP
jgi:hypothetical protein